MGAAYWSTTQGVLCDINVTREALCAMNYRSNAFRTSSVFNTHPTGMVPSPSLLHFTGESPQHTYPTSHGAHRLTLHLRMCSSACWVQHKHQLSANSGQAKTLLTRGLLLPNSCGSCYVKFFHTTLLQSWFYRTEISGNKKIQIVQLLIVFISSNHRYLVFLSASWHHNLHSKPENLKPQPHLKSSEIALPTDFTHPDSLFSNWLNKLIMVGIFLNTSNNITKPGGRDVHF